MPLAVIFDVDGVLIDSYRAHFQSWRQMFAELDVEFSEDDFRATFGRTNRDIFSTLFPGEMSDEQMTERGDRKEAVYREFIRQEFPEMPGAGTLIDQLADAGFALAVGSSGPPANIALTLQQLGRSDKIGAIVTSTDVTRGKPNPQVFLIAAERLGVPPEQCAVIEDATQGVEAANRARMTSIALTGTSSREELSAAKLVVDRLDELSPNKLETLIQGR